MKARDLIDCLSRFDPDIEVWCCGCTGDMCRDLIIEDKTEWGEAWMLGVRDYMRSGRVEYEDDGGETR